MDEKCLRARACVRAHVCVLCVRERLRVCVCVHASVPVCLCVCVCVRVCLDSSGKICKFLVELNLKPGQAGEGGWKMGRGKGLGGDP
jgi:hypothetical protein